MRRLASILIVLAACNSGTVAAADLIVLCYHEVRDEVRDYPDPYAVDANALLRQFAWLRGNGYTPVSLDDIVAARRGEKPLPPKPVLLSFDDAYLSFHTRVFPLLLEFRFPAVLGVVGKWIDSPSGAPGQYGGKGGVPDAKFPDWRQLREMADSGLVELASHTYDLHHGRIGNPQGNLEPAATVRAYDSVLGTYEDNETWRARVRADLVRNSDAIERGTGRRPRTIVWPYGGYNNELVEMAVGLGLTIGLTLDDGVNSPTVPLTALRRILVEHNPALAEIAGEIRIPVNPDPVRVVQVSLDEVYSPDPLQQERNLSVLLDRILELKPTQVYLQATWDADGDGFADAAYFPNRHMPMRSDLFNRTAWQLVSRSGVRVFAVMPVSGLRLPAPGMAEVYEDLARHASFHGLVFQDGPPEVTGQLAARAARYRAPLKTAGIARTMGEVTEFAKAYDYVVRTSMPAPGESIDPVSKRKLVYLLPASPELPSQLRTLQISGAINFGYGPDDFLGDSPPLARIAPAMSLRVHPR